MVKYGEFRKNGGTQANGWFMVKISWKIPSFEMDDWGYPQDLGTPQIIFLWFSSLILWIILLDPPLSLGHPHVDTVVAVPAALT